MLVVVGVLGQVAALRGVGRRAGLELLLDRELLAAEKTLVDLEAIKKIRKEHKGRTEIIEFDTGHRVLVRPLTQIEYQIWVDGSQERAKQDQRSVYEEQLSLVEKHLLYPSVSEFNKLMSDETSPLGHVPSAPINCASALIMMAGTDLGTEKKG